MLLLALNTVEALRFLSVLPPNYGYQKRFKVMVTCVVLTYLQSVIDDELK